MSQTKFVRRRHYFVDAKLQGALVARVVLYLVVVMFDIGATFAFWRLITPQIRLLSPHWEALWFEYGLAAVVALLLLAVVITDIIRFTNRFVGPILRLRRSMRAVARGEHVEPIRFRHNDFWQELADEFNAVLARVQQPTAEAAHAAPEEAEPEMACLA